MCVMPVVLIWSSFSNFEGDCECLEHDMKSKQSPRKLFYCKFGNGFRSGVKSQRQILLTSQERSHHLFIDLMIEFYQGNVRRCTEGKLLRLTSTFFDVIPSKCMAEITLNSS